MSYWKKNNYKRVGISTTLCSDTEAIDLSDKYENKTDNRNSGDNQSSGHVINLDDQTDDDSKSDQTDQKDQDGSKVGKRNPKCARCANHEPKPVPVKGHKRKCPYKDCLCTLCNLTVERRDLMAKTIREKRKQKEDLADNTYVYKEPVFKKRRSDECSSETDRESGYSTEDNNEKSKPMDRDLDHILDHESKKLLDGMLSTIWNNLVEHKISYSDIAQTLLLMYLKDNRTSIVKQKLTPKAIISKIIEVSKEKNSMTTVFAPLTPLTPTTPSNMSPMMSPPSSISSMGSSDSPNEIIRMYPTPTPNLLMKGHPFLPPYPFNPFHPPIHLPVLNHESYRTLNYLNTTRVSQH